MDNLELNVPDRAVRQHLFFFVFVLASILVFWTQLRELIRFSLLHDYASHIALVAPASAYLIWQKRHTIFARLAPDILTGSSLFLTAMILWWTAHLNTRVSSDYFSLEIIALIAFWISGFLLCYGRPAFRAARFPLLFLLLMVPIPSFLVQKIILCLQSASAAAAYWLLRAMDVSVFKEGFVLRFPTIDIEVSEECSGIRSSLALLITSLLVGEFLLRSFWRKSVLLLCVIPIVVLKNSLRIIVISLLTIYVNHGFIHGPLHTSGGVLFYVLGLLTLVPIMWLLRRSETRSSVISERRAQATPDRLQLVEK